MTPGRIEKEYVEHKLTRKWVTPENGQKTHKNTPGTRDNSSLGKHLFEQVQHLGNIQLYIFKVKEVFVVLLLL